MTTRQFVDKFMEEIADSADISYSDDKEGDFPHRGIPVYLALKGAADNHSDIKITDLAEVLRALRQGESHPIFRMVWEEVE